MTQKFIALVIFGWVMISIDFSKERQVSTPARDQQQYTEHWMLPAESIRLINPHDALVSVLTNQILTTKRPLGGTSLIPDRLFTQEKHLFFRQSLRPPSRLD